MKNILATFNVLVCHSHKRNNLKAITIYLRCGAYIATNFIAKLGFVPFLLNPALNLYELRIVYQNLKAIYTATFKC